MTNIASPWVRLLAYILELLIWTPIVLILLLLTQDLVLTLALLLVVGLVYISLTGYLISRFGGTLGKLLSGIVITTSQRHPLSFWMAIFRQCIGYTVSGLLLWFGFFWILIDKQCRGWHDQISDTYVIVSRKSGWILGLVSLIILILINIWLIRYTYLQFSNHAPLYQELFQSLSRDN